MRNEKGDAAFSLQATCRQETFFRDEDFEACRGLMAEWCRKCRVDIWAWCLMPNHVHLIAFPQSE